MAIKWFEKDNVKYVEISVSCRGQKDRTIRKQLRRRFEVVKDNMTREKAFREERKLEKEALRLVMDKEQLGMSFERLLELYEKHAMKLLKMGQWSQRWPCLMDSLSRMRRFAKDWLNEPAGAVTSAKITRLLYRLKLDGYVDKTLSRFVSELRRVYHFAICEELVPNLQKNPTAGVTVKRKDRKREEVLLHDEIKKLLVNAKIYEKRWYFIWSFAVYTGMRNGELFALKWSDIDFDPESPLIRVSRSYNKRTREYKCTKTGKVREIPICKPLMEVIKELKSWSLHQERMGNKLQGEFVLPRPGPWHSGLQSKFLKTFSRDIGITPICFHSLRACFATELLKRGVPVMKVMAVGGWSELKTMRHYVRLSGIDVKGVTNPLDFSSPEAVIHPDKEMMKAVGEKYSPEDRDKEKVVSLSPCR